MTYTPPELNAFGDYRALHVDELRVLNQFLRHQYISYENIQLLNLVRRIGELVDELDTRVSRTP